MAATKPPTKVKKPAKPKPEQSAIGRPTICTPELVKQFTELMAAGNYLVTACNYLGISEEDAYNWLKWGAEGKPATGNWPEAYQEFFKSTKRAEASAEVQAVARVQLAGREDREGQWQATMTFLERRHRDRWGRGEKVELTGAGGGPVQTQAVPVTEVLSNDRAIEAACDLEAALAAQQHTDAGGAGTDAL